MKNKDFPREGDVWIIKFDKLKEFSKPYRPCLVVSNDTQNEFDENIETFKVFIKNAPETGLDEPSKICCNYIHTVNKKLRLVDKRRLGVVSPEIMEKVKKAVKITLNLGS